MATVPDPRSGPVVWFFYHGFVGTESSHLLILHATVNQEGHRPLHRHHSSDAHGREWVLSRNRLSCIIVHAGPAIDVIGFHLPEYKRPLCLHILDLFHVNNIPNQPWKPLPDTECIQPTYISKTDTISLSSLLQTNKQHAKQHLLLLARHRRHGRREIRHLDARQHSRRRLPHRRRSHGRRDPRRRRHSDRGHGEHREARRRCRGQSRNGGGRWSEEGGSGGGGCGTVAVIST